MARVTIFSLENCKHCTRVKAAFQARKIRYTEISLAKYPEKRADMLALSDRLTVPQVFFDDDHIGGTDETINLLLQWEQAVRPNPLQRFRHVPVLMGPRDERLCIPRTPPLVPSAPPPRDETDSAVEIPGGRKLTVLLATETLLKIMPRADMSYRGRIYKNCFKGRIGVAAMMAYYGLSDPEEAIQFGRRLQNMRVLHHVTDDHAFGCTDNFFRLQPYHRPHVLNSFRVWTERVDPNYMSLLDRLMEIMGRIETACTDSNGLVDYVAAAEHREFLFFEEAVCELQAVMMRKMDEDTRRAFAINVYNLMIIHAFIKVGVPYSSTQRSTFYSHVCYDIGGDVLSFDDVEHGIIRANTRPPYQIKTPFSKDDGRYRLALEKLDPRIHFALNCGAKSCPPLKRFTSHAVKEELRIVAQAFCEGDENVSIDEEKCELSLSMIFNWYRSDFADAASKLPLVVVRYLRAERKHKLQRMIDSGRTVSVKFKKYDWSPIASKTKQFETSAIAANEMTFRALLPKNSFCGADTSLSEDKLGHKFGSSTNPTAHSK